MKKILILLLLLTIVIRVPTLFEPNRYADEDIYLTLGQGLRQGEVFYKDIHDNKPPLLYTIAAVAGNVRSFRIILLWWNLINVWLVWELAKKILKTKRGMIVTTGIFIAMSNIPLLEGNIANGEIFMIMPVTAAVLLFWGIPLTNSPLSRGEYTKYAAVGLLFSIGFLFKIPVAFDLFGILVWLLFFGKEKDKFKQVVLVLGGFFGPILVSLVYYYLMGAGEIYLRSALMQNIGYLSSWEGGEKTAFYQGGLFQRGVTALLFSGLVIGLKGKINKEWGLLLLWFVWGLFGANLSGRPYPHYLLEVVPAGSLLIGLMVEEIGQKKHWWGVVWGVLVFALVGVVVYRYDYWYYKSLPYYQNFIEYALGKKNTIEYKRFFGDGVIRNEKVAEYIKERTNRGQRIFVWGTEPAIYAISERLPVGRYSVTYHINDFKGRGETMEAIKKWQPKFIVWMKNEGSEFDDLKFYLKINYHIVITIDEAEIWEIN